MAGTTRNSMVGSYDILTGVWQLGVLRFGKDNFWVFNKEAFQCLFYGADIGCCAWLTEHVHCPACYPHFPPFDSFKQLDCMQTTQEPAWLESIWFLCSMFSRTWTASLPLSPTSFEQCKLLIHSLQCYMVSFENGSWFFQCLCLVLPVTWIKW